MTKSVFTSKMFWTNVVALIAMCVQGFTGKEIFSIELQSGILAFINIILRTITKDAVTWN